MAEEKRNYRKPTILQSFSSYSYYHILVACDGTETADVLSSNTEINRFKRFNFENSAVFEPGKGEPLGSKYQVRNTAGIGGGGSYITLVDGSVDADFIIQDVKWATIYAPDTKTLDGEAYTNTIELDGNMTIVEPNGVRLLDIISEVVCDGLDTDPTGIVFLLKTIFVGHHENGSTDTIATVRPLHFIITDIEADFETSGATYSIEFVGRENGVGKLQPVVAISKQTNANISKGSTLKAALEQYATNLNQQYTDQLQSFATQLKTTPEILKTQYRAVTYKINVDKAYDESYLITDMENIRTHNKDGDPIITAAANGGIEEMIARIMSGCEKQVLEGKAKPIPKGKKPDPLFAFRTVSRLDSSPDHYRIDYDVIRYAAPMSEADALIAGDDLTPLDEQVMEFDYIFTGQNTNVLDFKINMNMGLAFLQTLATTNNVPSQPESLSEPANKENANGKNTGPTASKGQANELRRRTPLFLGQQVDSLIARNSKQPVAAASFREMMNRWAYFENIEATITIAGNVELMDQGLKSAEQQAVDRSSRTGDNDVSGSDRHQQELAVAYNVPNFAKINIRMPDSNSLYPTYSDFWYRGFYVIMSVNNIFDEGKFTQQLELYSVPQIDHNKNGNDKDKKPGESGGTEPITDAEAEAIAVQKSAALDTEKNAEGRTFDEVMARSQARNKARKQAQEGNQ